MSTMRRAIGRSILSMRESRSMSQSELSRASGVSQAMISAIEGARKWPSDATLMRLLEALDYTPETLLRMCAVRFDAR